MIILLTYDVGSCVQGIQVINMQNPNVSISW
jgi:hypothetical protein